MKNKVEKNKTFEYEEEVEDFTGLIFHCPKCNKEFHLHFAIVDIKKYPKSKYGRTYKWNNNAKIVKRIIKYFALMVIVIFVLLRNMEEAQQLNMEINFQIRINRFYLK